MGWIIGIVGLVVIAALLYWQLILAEGAYLGRRVVILLYDWSARVYDRIKGFNPGYEQWFLGLPLTQALADFPDPLILDVATGTARLARTLFQQNNFRGRLIGVDLSRKMLQQAAQATEAWATRITFICQDAGQLPFPDETFDAVACLEALEFMPDPAQVLREMVRVLRPGGIFLITNRIGADARWLPGRTYKPETFEARLRALPLEMVRTKLWQEDYDLISAVKVGARIPSAARRLEEILRCPTCQGALQRDGDAFHCENRHTFPITSDGIIQMAR
ncbi:MAG TPA: class I SAM-dependent methyltransferase [Anaerolineae bacterium]|nr:class I SAM-dependent methyltransferase [Anaerolineae bacterium]HQI86552.1 class I SAM-dependent methyltransferase [Anaerolineae bacterium]